ncbi:plasmid mobilization protein [Clostridium tarantellae]|uniref:plasmid mobilization protein n=1 Tax=Clostridium tarantellae TaxID=39493 RepID=UPI001A9B73DC|nr:hypothetical protein [Clostridium tarantellae]
MSINRDKVVRLRVTEYEKDRLEEESIKRGLKMSELIRVILIESGIWGIVQSSQDNDN